MKQEFQRKKLRERAGKRSWEFEKRPEEGKGRELARKYLEEMKERSKEGKWGQTGKRRGE